MSKGYKGGDFEREISKRLSMWWSEGVEGKARDDVFWRSSQSGGRATQRAKSGKTTFGSYGDIAAVDPVGAPLLKLFTIELKRGSSHSFPGDWVDLDMDGKHPWKACLDQAIRSHQQAGSYAWMMICRRDRRLSIVYLSASGFTLLNNYTEDDLRELPHVRFRLTPETFYALRLEDFLRHVKPTEIIEASNE